MEWTRDPRTVSRFWSRVHKTDGCWLWLLANGRVINRYGRLRVGSRTDGTREELLMHWFSWELHAGPRTPGLQILHTCDIQACIRPDHLYEGTVKDNARDAKERKRSPKSRQTRCLREHEFTPENTIIYRNGTRHCRACKTLRARRLI